MLVTTEIYPVLPLWLRHETNVANIAEDSSGYENHGVYTGTTAEVGASGMCRRFTGLASKIAIPHHPLLHTENMTFATWVRRRDTTLQVIADKRTTINDGWVVYHNAAGVLNFRYGATGETNNWATGYTLPLDTWVFIALTRTPTGRDLYVNNVHIANTATAGEYTPNTADLWLGDRPYHPVYNATFSLDETTLWNVALQAKNIGRLQFGFNPMGIVFPDMSPHMLTWTDDGTSATITDATAAVVGAFNTPATLDGFPVVAIGDGAFTAISGLTYATIRDGITSIGDYAFQGCSSLKSIHFSPSVTSIGDYAFYGATDLFEVNIPNSVTSLGAAAFQGCLALVKIIIGANANIPEELALDCANLQAAYILNASATFGGNAFVGTSPAFKIHGYVGSTAETYANANGYAFEAIA